MPDRKPRQSRSQFALGLSVLRAALVNSEAEARLAIAAGKKAVAAARKKKNYTALKANLKTLAHAKKSQKNLAASVKLIGEACCEQTFGCDPTYV